MSTRARITVTTGPDRGKSYELTGEVMRLGRAPENDFVLSDPNLAEHQASIVLREGRYAIVTSVPEGLEIDGTEVPPERWVWLPEEANIKVSRRTSLQFIVNGTAAETEAPAEPPGAEAPPPDSAPTTPTVRAPGSGSSTTVVGRKSKAGSSTTLPRPKRPAGEKPDKKSRTVARFITDGPGEPLVKLGEDGHLPELTLSEAHVTEPREAQVRQSNPLVLLAAVLGSFALSVAMIFIDAGDGTSLADKKRQAQVEIETDYFGAKGETPAPYQLSLRQARQAAGRGDRETERQEYRRVLAMLRSESKDRFTGLTGRLDYDQTPDNKKSDKRLEELIAILLTE